MGGVSVTGMGQLLGHLSWKVSQCKDRQVEEHVVERGTRAETL